MSRVLAIIPARGGSKRLPGKNVWDFLGRPLIGWSVAFARSLRQFAEVIVSTDSPSIADVARAAGASVPWLRPPELASDTAATVDVVLHAIRELRKSGESFDMIAVLQPTTPFRRIERWTEALAAVAGGAPAALGVREMSADLFWSYRREESGRMTPLFPDQIARRSQDLPVACVPNGSLYLARVDQVEQYRSLAPPGVFGVLCDEAFESIDIDDAADWEEAERLLGAHLRTVA